MVIINKLCPVIATTLLFVVVSYVNGQSVVEVDSFLHNNDQFPVNARVKRQTATTGVTETGFNYDGDTISIGSDIRENNRRAKAAIVNRAPAGVNENSTGLTRIRRSKQDLCQHLCTCDTEGTEKFVTVSCSFLMDKVRRLLKGPKTCSYLMNPLFLLGIYIRIKFLHTKHHKTPSHYTFG